jgi:hypothetical protein
MAGARWLDAYGGQTTDELLALADTHRIDSLVLAFEQALQQTPRALSREERCVLAVEALEREVNNGGYNQFFVNSSREYTGEVEEALRAIGCPKTADITRDAIAALGIEGEMTDDKIEEAVHPDKEAVNEALGACDERYFSNDEPIADRLFAWIEANRAAIRVGS